MKNSNLPITLHSYLVLLLLLLQNQLALEANLGIGSSPKYLCVNHMCRVSLDRKYTPYMTVSLVISLPRMPYMHSICMFLDNPTYV